MRPFLVLLATCLLLPLAACGGGSTSDGPSALSPAVLGVVTSRDGSTADLAGVTARCPETGDVDVTDVNGHFELRVPRGRPFRVEFDDPTAPPREESGNDGGEGEDPDADGTDIDEDEVAIDALDDGEECDVEVDLEDGEVVEARVRRRDRERSREDYESEGRLDADDDEEGEAEIEVCRRDGSIGFEFEIEDLAELGTLTVKIVSADGLTEEILGVIEISLEGEGHLELTWNLGDALPLGATSVEELAGATIQIVNADEEILFEGEIPGFNRHDRREGDDDDDDEEDDDEDDESEEGDDDAPETA